VIAELGHFALLASLTMAMVQGIFPLLGSYYRRSAWIVLARPAAYSQLFFVSMAFAALTHAFVVSDFSIAYVAQNSNSLTPMLYKVTAVWGAHEGSLLLWALILAAWSGTVALFSRNLPDMVLARVLGIMGLVSIGFLAFLVFTSNPFERLWPIPADGRDLNPLLQDIGLAFHPPLLYMGYVGFVVPFAFAIAAMLNGRLDAAWARWSRPWTNIAWVFLTLGIALGSWWAYYELGWGGWWFWDPVENASFMPWLVGTALMHSLAVTEKRGAFKAWTVLLAIFSFALSLLGTFLVRSGVLTSVHAFASDPERGTFILVFLSIVVGGSLLLYAIRAENIRSRVGFDLISRETGLLLNNVLLTTTAAAVLLGTLYPLILDGLNLGKISVGPPYFEAIFIPLTVPMVFLIGIGTLARWKKDSATHLIAQLWPAAALSLVLALLLTFGLAQHFHWGAALGLLLAIWLLGSALIGLKQRLANKARLTKALATIPLSYWGMMLGHLGVAIFVVGVSLTSIYSIEKDVSLSPGGKYELGGYEFEFISVEHISKHNYQADRGEFRVSRNGQFIARMSPEKRVYVTQGMPMTEAAIDPGLTRDLFIAMGEPIGKGAWAVRLYHKPFIRWIWAGCLLMSLGGLLAASDRRYRSRKALKAPAATGLTSTGAST
jgi:cytochrome c-type biogenesis protein CcmF